MERDDEKINDGIINDDCAEEQSTTLDDGDIKAWSDYLKVNLHPTSVIELPFWSFNEPFSVFASGTSKGVIGQDDREAYFDKIRVYAEECDYLRNITVLADFHDGFGGLTCSLLEEIRDEFPRMTVVSYTMVTLLKYHDTMTFSSRFGGLRRTPFPQNQRAKMTHLMSNWARSLYPSTIFLFVTHLSEKLRRYKILRRTFLLLLYTFLVINFH